MYIVICKGDLGRELGEKPLLVYERKGDSIEDIVQAILPGPKAQITGVEECDPGVWLALHKGRGYVMLVNLDDVFSNIDKR